MKQGPKAEKCYSEERGREIVTNLSVVLPLSGQGSGAFVCLFVSYTERMDAISPAIQAGPRRRVPQVIFHVRN